MIYTRWPPEKLMAIPSRHLAEQGRVISALGRLAATALKQNIRGSNESTQVPGPVLRETVAPPSRELVADYLRLVGGSPRSYAESIPVHLFPQWTFPLAARALEGIDYPIQKVLNGGCSVQVNAPIPAGEPLELTGQLESIDDNGKRVLLRTRITTSTAQCPDALVAVLLSYIPLASSGSSSSPGQRRGKPCVPRDAREVAFWSLKPRDARSFALLTGDINPVHWIKPYARAMGFRGTILHGFSTMAHAIEGLNRTLFSSDVTRLASFEARFTRPLVLPAKVGLYIDGDGAAYVGDCPGGPAYMVADYTTHPTTEFSV
jgi:hypothetical protein